MFGSSKKVSLKLKEGQKAFSLIELLVSLTIMTIVTTVVLARHQSFNGTVLLRNQAYDIAYTIRQAQLMAVSSTSNSATPSLNQAYGVHVDIINNTYHIFQDANNDGRFTAESDNIIGPQKRLDTRFNFRQGDTCCSGAGGPQNVSSALTIVFVRPNFDAHVRRNNETGRRTGPSYLNIAVVGSGNNDESPNVVKRVEILNSGNISVVNY